LPALKLKYAVLLSRQAERFYKKLEGKIKAQAQECLISLEEEAYTFRKGTA